MPRQFKIVPVPSAPAKPKEVELRYVDYNTVVEADWTAGQYVVFYDPESLGNHGMVNIANFRRAMVCNFPRMVRPVGRMVNGSFVADPAPAEEWPMVKDLPFGTVVELGDAVYVKHQCEVRDCGWALTPFTWGTLNKPGKCFTHSDRLRVLGTLAPMTLADFEATP